ncbi:MAG: serine/threonine protein kinase [Myxococcales bacterium]|nr:serine/threonine protein kinase [Myxococcales bacterium]
MNSPSRIHVTVGAVVAETYKLEALIGRGGMGEVYAASHLRLPGKHVAIKFLHPEVSDPEILARFRREAEIASRLGHPNIVTVLDFNSLPDGTPYLVLEYLVGETLADALQHGPFSLERTCAIARQVGSALAAAHRAGVVHRDLKPQNIFLVPAEIDGRLGENAKVLDFGISKIRGSQTVKTQDSALLGTPQYMAPEQAMGQHDSVDGRTDIFALGAILYEMLTGHSAFAGASIPEVVFKVVYESPPPLAERAPGLPPSVVAAVERAMAKKADDRFATTGELVTALTGVGLATLPPNSMAAPDLRTPSRKVDSAAALAKTMGSGDHADAMAATSAGALPAPSYASTAGPSSAGGPGGAAAAPTSYQRPRASVESPAPAALTASPPAASRWKWLALGFAAIASAAGAFVLVRPAPGSRTEVAQQDPGAGTGAGPSTPSVQPATLDAGPQQAPDAAAVDAAAAPSDAAASSPGPDAGVAPTAAVDAGPAPPSRPPQRPPTRPPSRPTPPSPPPTPPEDEPGEIGEKLAKAWRHVETGNDQAAKTLANSIVDDANATERARRQASQIIVLIACRGEDRETAVRAAKRARGLRPKIIAECRAHDIELPRRGL